MNRTAEAGVIEYVLTAVPLLGLVDPALMAEMAHPCRAASVVITHCRLPGCLAQEDDTLFLWPALGLYLCTACDGHGTVITWVVDMENLTVPEAVEWLIEHYNLMQETPHAQR